jgi:hypothetical protein
MRNTTEIWYLHRVGRGNGVGRPNGETSFSAKVVPNRLKKRGSIIPQRASPAARITIEDGFRAETD